MGSIDRRELASSAVRAWQRQGAAPTEEARATAGSDVELKDTVRWSRIWIVLDNLEKTTLSEDIEDLITGLTGVGVAETGVPPELRRIRWIFLTGRDLPKFAGRDDVTIEDLHPDAIGVGDMVDAIVEFASSMNIGLGDKTPALFAAVLEMLLKRESALLSDPLTRLETLQQLFEEFRSDAVHLLSSSREPRVMH